MSSNLSAYVERKKGDGEWELISEKPISTRLKYVIDNYNGKRRIQWDDLSKGLKDIYKTDESTDELHGTFGASYCTFYVSSLDELESDVSVPLIREFTKINTIIKSLGCHPIYGEDGEMLPFDDGENEDSNKLTFSINKSLIEDIQLSLDRIRNIGQREMFDLILDEYIEYDSDCSYRVIFVFA